MYLHFYVTYVIIALHYLTESETAALKNIRYVKENEKWEIYYVMNRYTTVINEI